jgi:hypothetical protein
MALFMLLALQPLRQRKPKSAALNFLNLRI